MAVAEKSGMLINDEKEVIGWVLAGDEYDCKEGDQLVTHHKTAEKLGLGDVFKEMKAENAPKKETKAVDGKPRSPRKPVPTTGTYTVVKPDTLKGEPCERTNIAQLLADNTDFATFWEKAPKTFKHVNRAGEEVEFKTSGFVAYAIKRGIITVDA